MSHFRDARQLTLAGATAALAFGALASSAAAATVSNTYTCKFPLIGTQGATLAVSADFPASVQAGDLIPSTAVTSEVTFSSVVSDGLSLIDGIASADGTITTTAKLTTPDGGVVTINLPGEIAATALDPMPNPLGVGTTVQSPAITIDTPGTATIAIQSFALNLTIRNASGDVIQLPPPSGTVDSDGNPDTFDVNCVLSPADQNAQLASIAILGGPVVGAPTISNVVGPKPKAGVGGQVSVKGTGLASTTSVSVGGTAATFAVQGKQLKVQLPALPAGSYPLVVTNGSGASAPTTVTYK